MTDLEKSLALLEDTASSFVSHWMDDDDPADQAAAVERAEEVSRAHAQLANALSAARAMLAALRDLTDAIPLGTLKVKKDFSLMVRHAAAVKAIAAAEAAGITTTPEG